MTGTVPRLALTMGDPAGIGPELCLQLLNVLAEPSQNLLSPCLPLVFGDQAILQKVSEYLDADFRARLLQTPVVPWEHYLEAPEQVQQPTIIDMNSLSRELVQPGQVSAACGAAAYLYVERAIQQAMAGDVAGIVTCPIHKEALHAAQIPFPGHTEILAAQTHAERIVMMLTSPTITCSLVTAHVGYHEVPGLLTQERIQETIQLTYETMKVLRQREPRLILCGLNPHAGEHGLFGRGEEEQVIEPAARWAREQGMSLVGPLPPDTAFLPAKRNDTDAYICLYHDQGLIPLKALAFDEAVNVTLGLPIIRTSVDHGTAFDIAWQGKAEIHSLIQAVNLACQLAAASK